MQNRIIGVVAPKGSGKTTRIADYIRTEPRVAIYDPMAQTDLAYRVVASHIVKEDLHEVHTIIAEENFQLLYEPKLPTQDGEEWRYSDFPLFLLKVWRRVQLIGPMLLVVDEAHYTMSARTMPLEMWNVITNGRRYGLDVIWVTQRFVGVNNWVRANADEYWLFRLASVPDLKAVADIAGNDVAEEVKNLRRLDVTTGTPGQLLIWNSLDGSVTIEDRGANDAGTGSGTALGADDGHATGGTDGAQIHQGERADARLRGAEMGGPARRSEENSSED